MFVQLLKTKWYYIVTLLLIGLSNAYFTTVTSFSPAYIGILLAPLSFIFFINSGETIRRNVKTIGIFIFIFAFLLLLLIDCLITGNTDKASYYFNYWFYNHFIFILCVYYFQRCNLTQIIKIIKVLFVISSLVFIIDFIYRMNNARSDFSGLLAFYNFKFNSIMFLDSNWPGFMSMLLFSVLVYLKDNHFLKSNKILFFSFLLVIQTLSRAAMASCVAVLLFSRFIRLRKKIKYYIIVIGTPFMIVLVIFMLTKLTDASFLSKLEILKGMLYYITHFDLHTLIWGNYPDACHDSLRFMHVWIGGHLYMTRYIDFGFITALFEFIIFALLCIYTHFKALYIILPFLIAGISFAPWNLPYMYCLLGLIYVLENSLYKDNEQSFPIKFNIKRDL